MLSSRLRRSVLIGVLSWSSFGCGDDSNDDTAALPRPIIVSVSPAEFASPPACGASPGSLVSYVATLVDVTAAATGGGDGGAGGGSGNEQGFALPSSALQVEYAPGQFRYEPVPCLRGVDFGWVVSGHVYRTELLGFDRGGLELLEAGLPIVIDSATRSVVEPRWTATCGNGSHAVRAEIDLTRVVRYCEPWVER